jgi:hypothetical protein
MIMMIQGMVQDGKSRDEIRGYLMREIGLKGDEADKFLGEVMPDDRSSEGMYR